MIRSQSFSEPVPLNVELHVRLSVIFSPLRWNRMSREAWGWVLLFPKLGSPPITPTGGVWLTSFSWGQTSWRRGVLWWISKWFTFPPCVRSPGRCFSDLYSGNLAELLELNLVVLLGPPHDWRPLDFLTLRVAHFDLQYSAITVRVFLLQAQFPWQFVLVSLFCKLWFLVFTCRHL